MNFNIQITEENNSATYVEVSNVVFGYLDVVRCDVFVEVGHRVVVTGVAGDVEWLHVEVVGEWRSVILVVNG